MTEEERREYNRDRQTLYRARITADPKIKEEQLVRHRAAHKQWLLKISQDPQKMTEMKKRRKTRQQQLRAAKKEQTQ